MVLELPVNSFKLMEQELPLGHTLSPQQPEPQEELQAAEQQQVVSLIWQPQVLLREHFRMQILQLISLVESHQQHRVHQRSLHY